MAGQIVPNQQHLERWQPVGQRARITQASLPAFPQGTRHQRILGRTWQRLGRHNRAEFGLQPGMQDLIGAGCDTFDTYLTAGRVEQC